MNFFSHKRYPKFREEYLKYWWEPYNSKSPESWAEAKRSSITKKLNLFIEIKNSLILIKSKPHKNLPELWRIDSELAQTLDTDPCYIYLRPFTRFFLRSISNSFRIIVFSEIPSKLLNYIISWIQQNNDFISFWLSNSKTNKIKDLSQFYYPLGDSDFDEEFKHFIENNNLEISCNNSIIIDQEPWVVAKNSTNWVPILKYRGLSNDSTLLYLVKYLLELSTFEDITAKITNDFKLGILKTNLLDLKI